MTSLLQEPPSPEKTRHLRQISYDLLYSKVLGAWLGKSIGGAIGAPFEVHKILGTDVTKEDCWPLDLIPNDDLDIQLLWLEVMEEQGVFFTQQELGEYWERQCWYNFAEYSFFLYNQRRGIHAPESGRFNNEFYSESMGCPIRSEIWGIAALGNPKLAAEFALMDGELDHINESIWCEQFWAAAEAEAFFCDSINEALEVGSRFVPADSAIMDIYTAVRDLWALDPNPDLIWQRLNRSYGNRDGSKVHINFALQLLSLFAAPDDFELLMVECARYGYDVDSTAATVGALIGILKGPSALPTRWIEKLGNQVCCGIDVRHRNATYEEITEDTLKVVLEMCALRNTGVVITDVPEAITKEVELRISNRALRPGISLTSTYSHGPGLDTGHPTAITISIHNLTDQHQSGILELEQTPSIGISPPRAELQVAPHSTTDLTVQVESIRQDAIPDRNLFIASWKGSESVSRTFGVSGKRQYLVYGPYWDAYDTSRWSENPFRRPGYRCHPLQVPGIPLTRVHVHNFARLDRPYLDENSLLRADIPSEDPYIVQCPEDYVTNSHLGGFVGEACYYFVREIIAPSDVECTLSCGSTNPFIIWKDGTEIARSEHCDTWGFQEHTADVLLTSKPSRFVIKIIKQVEEIRLFISFWRKGLPNAGRGVSIFHDEFSDVIPPSRYNTMRSLQRPTRTGQAV
jgi:ADP-ribosylglycohydrolase